MGYTPQEQEDELTGQILWIEALVDCLLDGQTDDAIKALEAYLKLLRKQRKALKP